MTEERRFLWILSFLIVSPCLAQSNPIGSSNVQVDPNTGYISVGTNTTPDDALMVNGGIHFLLQNNSCPQAGGNDAGICLRTSNEVGVSKVLVIRAPSLLFETSSGPVSLPTLSWSLLVDTNGNANIGAPNTLSVATGTVKSKLEVYGNLEVGSDWSRIYGAPQNGLIVQSQILIGKTTTTATTAQLDVHGPINSDSALEVNGSTVCTSAGCAGVGGTNRQLGFKKCTASADFSTTSTGYQITNLTCQFSLAIATDTVEIFAAGSFESVRSDWSGNATIARDGTSLGLDMCGNYQGTNDLKTPCSFPDYDTPGDTFLHTYSVMIKSATSSYAVHWNGNQVMTLKELNHP